MTKIEQLNVTFFDKCFLDVTAERKSGESNYIKKSHFFHLQASKNGLASPP